MKDTVEFLLLAALLFAGVLFWRTHALHARGQSASPYAPEPDAPNAPPGAFALALGQFAVAPEKRWLLIKPQGGY